MKILITGSHGQLGNELSAMLATGEAGIGRISDRYAGCEVIAVDVEDLDITDTEAVNAFVAEIAFRDDLEILGCGRTGAQQAGEQGKEKQVAEFHMPVAFGLFKTNHFMDKAAAPFVSGRVAFGALILFSNSGCIQRG